MSFWEYTVLTAVDIVWRPINATLSFLEKHTNWWE